MNGQYRDGMRKLDDALVAFSADVMPLHGIADPVERRVLVEQLISSLRRIAYVRQIGTKKLDPRRADPTNSLFDPLMAASLAVRSGNHDQAWWLTFIATHFGKHHIDGWRLARDFYGAFGAQTAWSWGVVDANPNALMVWLDSDWQNHLEDGVSRRFSNHRKYESKKPDHLKKVFGSYVALVKSYGKHQDLMRSVHETAGQNPREAFDELYRRMSEVGRFGRLGLFDFLTMLGKLDAAPIEPGIAYLSGATGPLAGARLLVAGNAKAPISPRRLEEVLQALDHNISVGQQVLEDALCNWQKSPSKFKLFRG